jgi:hypothetical protein
MFDQSRELRRMARRLRDERPAPSAELMRSLSARPARRRPAAFALALTAVLAVSLASVGGVSYAATAVNQVAKVAQRIVTPTSHHAAATSARPNAGGDQYKPGYGFGDPNHNHDGPPGLAKGKPGEKTPPAQTKSVGKAIVVSSSITTDEQAALYFSVLDAAGNPLLLTQRGTKIGSAVDGPQTKSIHYVVLVPRTVPFTLRIPSNLLVPGQTYNVRVIAVDKQGNKTTVLIPFTT